MPGFRPLTEYEPSDLVTTWIALARADHLDRHERDGDAANARLARLALSVVVLVVVDVSRKGRGQGQREVVALTVVAPLQRDLADDVGRGDLRIDGAADVTRRGADAEIAGRVRLYDLVRPGEQVGELIVALGVGGCRLAGVDIAAAVELPQTELDAATP